jgi:hypothetical protein
MPHHEFWLNSDYLIMYGRILLVLSIWYYALSRCYEGINHIFTISQCSVSYCHYDMQEYQVFFLFHDVMPFILTVMMGCCMPCHNAVITECHAFWHAVTFILMVCSTYLKYLMAECHLCSFLPVWNFTHFYYFSMKCHVFVAHCQVYSTFFCAVARYHDGWLSKWHIVPPGWGLITWCRCHVVLTLAMTV